MNTLSAKVDLSLYESCFNDLKKMISTAYYLNEKSVIRPDLIKLNKLDKENNSEILDNLRTNGYVVIDLNYLPHLDVDDLALWQENILGTLIYNKANNKPYYKVQVIEGKKNYVSSSYSQSMHTDEGYKKNYPNFLSLLCIKPALRGGVTTLSDFSTVYPVLLRKFEEDVHLLEKNDAVTLEGIAGKVTKPIIIYRQQENRRGISYCPALHSMSCSTKVFELFNYLTNYLHNPINQIRFKLMPKQLLMIDNFRMLHGRTAFGKSDPRLLYRYWFDERTI